jgi:hypothetical protein
MSFNFEGAPLSRSRLSTSRIISQKKRFRKQTQNFRIDISTPAGFSRL